MILAHVSEPLAPSTVTTQTVSVRAEGGAVLPISVNYDAIGDRIEIVLRSALVMDTRYVVSMGQGVTDLAGMRWGRTMCGPLPRGR
ncbi:MAG: Ig-like domain-containing protein [Caldilineaceae bacterium]